MNFSKEELKKKIVYRSNYRGSKEIDSLLSSFTKKYINLLNYEELVDLLNLLDLDDENLYNFNQDRKTSLKFPINKITDLFKFFNLNEK
jgi:antitoxin CptB